MQVFKSFSDINIKNTSLALGFFDGVHIGHQKVLNSAIDLSKQLGTKSVVMTFQNHPVEVLYDVIPEFITTFEERLKIFEKMGFDAVVIPEFTREIAKLDAKNYFDEIILKLRPKSVSTGYNHKFGANHSGDINFLAEMSKQYGFILNVTPAVKVKSEATSSTLIRNLIKEGNVNLSQKLLGKPYCIKNTVEHGEQRGHTIGFPTANIFIPDKKIVPKFGVYKCIAEFDDKKYTAIANVGLRPTFSDIEKPLIEVHIPGFNGDLYGKSLSCQFTNYMRNEIRFKNIEQLKERIIKDIQEL